MKLIKALLLAVFSLGSAQAATVTLTAGFGSSGIVVTSDGVNAAYTVEVGGFQGGVFTLLAAPAVPKLAGDKIAGGFVYTGVDTNSLTGDQIFVRITTSGGVAILGTSAVEVFPDLTQTLPSNSVTIGSSSTISVAQFSGAENVSFSNANTLNFVTVPEPSIALLGALGVFGLIRRRR